MDAAKVMRGEMSAENLNCEWSTGEDIYGSKYPRPTALAKVCGVCDYGDDIKLQMPETVLHVAVVQPRITHHANILSIDSSEACRMPGVVKVITAADVKGTNVLPLHWDISMQRAARALTDRSYATGRFTATET
jgi:aldehyde oxidoreductase